MAVKSQIFPLRNEQVFNKHLLKVKMCSVSTQAVLQHGKHISEQTTLMLVNEDDLLWQILTSEKPFFFKGQWTDQTKAVVDRVLDWKPTYVCKGTETQSTYKK